MNFRCLVVAGLLIAGCGHAAAGELRLPENEVKAAILVNIPQLVRRQGAAERSDRPTICTFAPPALDAALARQAGQGGGTGGVTLRPVSGVSDQLRSCTLVFVGNGDAGTLLRVAVAVAHSPVLLVAEGIDALQQGAMIGLYVQDGRVGIEINLGALKNAGLDASAKLLGVARRVVE